MFTLVMVCQVLSVAFPPASRRRSDFKSLSSSLHRMAEVFHLGGMCSFTAHDQMLPTSDPSLPFLG